MLSAPGHHAFESARDSDPPFPAKPERRRSVHPGCQETLTVADSGFGMSEHVGEGPGVKEPVPESDQTNVKPPREIF